MNTLLRVAMLVLILGVTAMSPLAQNLPEGDERNAAFLSYMAEIEGMNPQIRDFTKMQPGTLYRLPNGQYEEIGQFDTNGIWGREFQKAYRLSYEEFLQNRSGSTLPETGDRDNSIGQQPMVIQIPVRGSEDSIEWVLEFLFLALIAGLLGYAAYLAAGIYKTRRREDHDRRQQAERSAERERNHEREISRDPVTSGPPIVPGGIAPTETERLSHQLHDQATAQYVRENRVGMEYARTRITRVGPIEHGTISGYGMVGYLDGKRPRHITTPIPGYRARFRFPDGSEQYLMSLQGCMNPCYAGQEMLGFTFTVNPQNGTVVEAPPPAPAPATPIVAQPVASQPIVTKGPEVVSASRPIVKTDHAQFITFVPANETQPAMIRWQGLQFRRFEQFPDGMHIIRFEPATPEKTDVQQ